MQEKEINRNVKISNFAIAGVTGIISFYLAYIINIEFFVFIFCTIAVLAFALLIFMPFELYKDKVRLKKTLGLINHYLEKNTLQVIPIAASRIAKAEEYEDEGDLFIVEYETKNIVYLWDYDYKLKKVFLV